MDKISFKDIINGKIFNIDFVGAVDIYDILIGLFITLILSFFIFFIYKKTYSGVVYSHNFNVSLVLMALITSLIIMTIRSNLVLSLGMVGALSIVRFRTAVKDPMDTIFMLWAVALGITAGAQLYAVAIIGTTFVGIIAVLLLRYKNSNNVFMLIIHYEEDAQETLYRRLSELDYRIKSKTVSMGMIELTLELKLVGIDTSFIEEISEIEGVKDTSLVSYNGNFIG